MTQARFIGEVETRWLDTDSEYGCWQQQFFWAFAAAGLALLLGSSNESAVLTLLIGLYVLIPQKARDMVLLSDFSLIVRGKTWTAKAGTVINGANVPWPLWRLIDPFIGNHRRASAIHDAACKDKARGWWETHWVFFLAMRADGTLLSTAILMWLGVVIGGPKWRTPATGSHVAEFELAKGPSDAV